MRRSTPSLTSDPDERNSISTYRQIGGNSAAYYCQPRHSMVRFFGHGNDVLGYQLTMGVLSVLSILFFIVAFLTTKERIQPNPQQRSSLSQDLSDLFSNGPWIVLFLATLFISAAIRGARQRDAALLPLRSGNVDLFSWFTALAWLRCWWAVAFSTAVTKRLGKRFLFIASMTLLASSAPRCLSFRRKRPSRSSRSRCCGSSSSGFRGR